MQLHHLQKSSAKKRAQRVGRGGKRGTTSGRGQKGQKSRSGRRIRPAVRDLVLRIAKRRGFRNKPKSPKPFIISLSELDSRIKSLIHGGKVKVTREVLVQLGLLAAGARGAVKVLGKKDVHTTMELSGILASSGAKEKIEKAGGTVIAN